MALASGRFWREFLESMIIALALAFFLRTLVVESFQVSGNSMEPTLHDGERLLINKLTYHFRPPAPGEIVVFKYPRDPSQDYIKRVVAVAGERVAMVQGSVYRDGRALAEPYLPAPGAGDWPAVLVGAGEVFVLGDNRAASEDSRTFGPVGREYIRGCARLTYWPLWRIRTLR